jgi:hypothetical protein
VLCVESRQFKARRREGEHESFVLFMFFDNFKLFSQRREEREGRGTIFVFEAKPITTTLCYASAIATLTEGSVLTPDTKLFRFLK